MCLVEMSIARLLDVNRLAQQQPGSARSLSACGSARQQTRTPRGSRSTPRTSSSATPAADGSAVIVGGLKAEKHTTLLHKAFDHWFKSAKY